MLEYLLGYFWFIMGSALYILGKMKEFKATAKANPRPDVVFSYSSFFNDEVINIAMLMIGGIAFIYMMPMLIGDGTIALNNSKGELVTTFALKTALMPIYFLVGYSGNSALFTLFGKYKKTFFNQLGVSDSDSVG